jgi:pyrimidine-nucleoside phosphorylase
VETVGACIMGQSDEICPVDKRMYSLRDVTGTIDSVPLICGSIMSKKIAEGIRGLVLDIKVGNGAFMKSIQNAQELGKMMIKIGNHFGVKTEIVYSSMNQPLGRFAGNWCEVKESIDCLRGSGSEDIMCVVIETCSVLLLQSEIVSSKDDAIELITKSIQSGSAYEKWIEMVTAQSGDASTFDRLEKQNIPECTSEILAESTGFVSEMDTLGIGNAGIPLGIGRATKNEFVDPTSGMEFLAKIGDEVQEGDPLIRLFNSNKDGLEKAKSLLIGTIVISVDKPKPHQLILGKS